MSIINVVIGLLILFAGNQPSDCNDFAMLKQLIENSPQSRHEYRGQYVNQAYKYSVRIPEGLTAYDGRDQARHNGFAIALGKEIQSVIFVSGDPNSSEYKTPREAAMEDVKFFRKQGKKIESEAISDTHLGALDAAFLVVIYTCPGSEKRYVKSSITAISPDKRFFYQLELYSSDKRYETDRAVLDQLVKSWKVTETSQHQRKK